MRRKWNAPGAGHSARGRDCLPGPAGTPKIPESGTCANGITLETCDGEVRTLWGLSAKLVCDLANAGPDGLRLSGADLALAKTIAADGMPLRIGQEDAKGRAWVTLDAERLEEVRHGA